MLSLVLSLCLIALALLCFCLAYRAQEGRTLRARWLSSVGGQEDLSALDGYLERIQEATRQGSDESVPVARRLAEATETLGAFADAVRELVSVNAAPLADVVVVLRLRLAPLPPVPPLPRSLPWTDPAQDGEAVHTSVGRPLPLAPQALAQPDDDDPTLPYWTPLSEAGIERALEQGRACAAAARAQVARMRGLDLDLTQENTAMGRIYPLSPEEVARG